MSRDQCTSTVKLYEYETSRTSGWEALIQNRYLGQERRIKSTWHGDVANRAQVIADQWTEKAQQRYDVADLKSTAEQMNQDAAETLESIRTTLVRSLDFSTASFWDAHIDRAPFPEREAFREKPIETPPPEVDVLPDGALLDKIFKSRIAKREAQKAEAERVRSEHEARYAGEVTRWEEENRAAQAEYDQRHKKFLEEQSARNAEVERFRSASLAEDATLFATAVQMATDTFNDGIYSDPDVIVMVDAAQRMVEFDVSIPGPDDMPKAKGFKYVASRREVDPILLKAKEADALYDDFVFQTALAFLAFGAREFEDVKEVTVNLWVSGIDRSTGKDFTSCVLSLHSSVDEISGVRFEHVDAKECVRSFRGLYAGKLASLTPVKPIVNLNTEDARFVESRDVLDELDPTQNLAIMDWEAFEHLVRQLFGAIFGGGGGEVKVTQASRDQGVDAIAFDPDPIRGGKFVIQAKRYNNVVGVSAVRDLYGTMLNEGASRGLLVTTSYFGADSRNFAKDKPIQLIDGQNLLALLQEYGYGQFNITLGTERPSE